MREELARRGELTHAQERATMAAGPAHAREAKAAWTGADLIHCIGQYLPDRALGRDQEHAWRYLERLTDRAIAGEAGEEVLRLDSGERQPLSPRPIRGTVARRAAQRRVRLPFGARAGRSSRLRAAHNEQL
jgi:hypothetical protein